MHSHSLDKTVMQTHTKVMPRQSPHTLMTKQVQVDARAWIMQAQLGGKP